MMIKSHFLAGTAFGGLMNIVPSFDTEGGGSGGGEGAGAPAGEGQTPAEPTAEEALEKEFGYNETPESEDGDGDEGAAEESGEDEGEGDGDGTDGDESDEGEGDGDDKAKPEDTAAATARVQELTTAAEKADADLATARAEAEKAGVSLDVPVDAVDVPEEPDPSKYTYGEHDQDYIKDHAKWEAKMEIVQEQATARIKVEAASLDAKWTKNLIEANQKYPDFQKVVVDGAENWDCPPVIALGIKDSDVGADVAYDLAKNPGEAKRIAKLSPLEQAREFGRLEERHSQRIASEKGKASEEEERKRVEEADRKVSKAPQPPKRQVRGSGGKFGTPDDTDDFLAFDRAVDERAKAKGR
jgi:hypothetical protein